MPADFPLAIVDRVETPCYLISEDAVRRNCEILAGVRKRTGARILLALKAFALPALFPLIRSYLDGVCASGPIEARLGREDFGGEVHTCAPAYTTEQMARVIQYSDVVLFNSLSQLEAHGQGVARAGRKLGLRVNPGHSEVAVDLYNPCMPGSRFGVHPRDLRNANLTGISGFHFHALCEQQADVLVRVLESFETLFGDWLDQLEWVNFGGGHHITRSDYDLDLLYSSIDRFRHRYRNIDVYLEPGEAVVLDAGVFVTSVLDVIHN
jgi:carboxynorspermidine decarboxylase